MNKQNLIAFIEAAEESLIADDIRLMIKGFNPAQPVPDLVLKKLIARIRDKLKHFTHIEESLQKRMKE